MGVQQEMIKLQPHKYKNKAICLFCRKEFIAYNKTLKCCSQDCASKYKVQCRLEKKIILFKEGKLRYRRDIRLVMIHLGVEYKCSKCNIKEWQGKPITLWLDHIDGNSTNNASDNFRFVCPNCDSQSETFGAKNWGNGRISKGFKPYY